MPSHHTCHAPTRGATNVCLSCRRRHAATIRAAIGCCLFPVIIFSSFLPSSLFPLRAMPECYYIFSLYIFSVSCRQPSGKASSSRGRCLGTAFSFHAAKMRISLPSGNASEGACPAAASSFPASHSGRPAFSSSPCCGTQGISHLLFCLFSLPAGSPSVHHDREHQPPLPASFLHTSQVFQGG